MTLDELIANVRGSLQEWATTAEADDFAPWVVAELRAMAEDVEPHLRMSAYMRKPPRVVGLPSS